MERTQLLPLRWVPSLTANANIPVNAIAGVSLIVANTVGAEVGDTALVETYLKSGKEPSIGTPYFLNVTRRSLLSQRACSIVFLT